MVYRTQSTGLSNTLPTLISWRRPSYSPTSSEKPFSLLKMVTWQLRGQLSGLENSQEAACL